MMSLWLFCALASTTKTLSLVLEKKISGMRNYKWTLTRDETLYNTTENHGVRCQVVLLLNIDLLRYTVFTLIIREKYIFRLLQVDQTGLVT